MSTIHPGAAPAAPACEPPARSAASPAPAPAVPGRIAARVIAVLAMALGVAHVWILAAFPHGLWMSLLVAAMVALCLKCAHRAWGTPQALLELLAMSALMALVHMFMALGSGHQHGSHPVASGASAASGAMLAIAAAEVLLVVLCSIGMRRISNPGRPAPYLA